MFSNFRAMSSESEIHQSFRGPSGSQPLRLSDFVPYTSLQNQTSSLIFQTEWFRPPGQPIEIAAPDGGAKPGMALAR
jgi:hypothetical protein